MNEVSASIGLLGLTGNRTAEKKSDPAHPEAKAKGEELEVYTENGVAPPGGRPTDSKDPDVETIDGAKARLSKAEKFYGGIGPLVIYPK